MRQALEDLIEAVETAINAGDWKVDGACDPTLALIRAKEALEQPEQDNAYIYASNLAKTIWQKHYIKESPKFALLDTTEGVLTQIDNMTCGLVREKPAQPEQEPVAWEQFYPDIGKPQIAINSETVGYVAPQLKIEGSRHVICQCDKCKAQEQEPVAFDVWLQECESMTMAVRHGVKFLLMPEESAVRIGTAIQNTTPLQRTWVDLTDDEMLMIYGQNHEGKKYNLGRMVQQALKEKNS